VVIADRSLSPYTKVSSPEDACVSTNKTSSEDAIVRTCVSTNTFLGHTDMMISEIWMVKCFAWQYGK
jgi:hypothetical protein